MQLPIPAADIVFKTTVTDFTAPRPRLYALTITNADESQFLHITGTADQLQRLFQTITNLLYMYEDDGP